MEVIKELGVTTKLKVTEELSVTEELEGTRALTDKGSRPLQFLTSSVLHALRYFPALRGIECFGASD
jgi:hypothetical protein